MNKPSNRHLARAVAAVFGLAALASPAAAQIDLSGEWAPRFFEDQPERVPGPDLGDFAGIPISDAARWRGETWTASLLTLPEWQCRPHSADYIWRGPSNLTISRNIDPVSRDVTNYEFEWLRSIRRPIYLDGRAHPSPNAPHTWAGFSSAAWRGDMLEIKTTHLKEGYLRRNGLPRSDSATLKEYLIRNEDILTVVTLVNDPVYLTEAFIRTTDYELDLKQRVPPYPCHVVEEIDRPKGEIPHLLPGADRSVEEFAADHAITVEAARGGAATQYPGGKLFTAATTGPTQPARPGVPVDLTGQWVSVVTEDWRWRMMTPPKGDYASVPLNPEGVSLVKAWDPAADEAAGLQCRAYGAAAVMRAPGQIRISWQDERSLKVETEAGSQTRLLHFDRSAPAAGQPTWQGVSEAVWRRPGRQGGPGAVQPPPGGSLQVVTTGMLPGYLRKNGVPYSEQTRLTEHYNRIDEENGQSWLIVTTIVEDPKYLGRRFFTSSHFKKVRDDTPWAPGPCSAR